MAKSPELATKIALIALLTAAEAQGIDVVKTENLYAFDGKAAYSLGQGQ
jgi:isocitrate dehydrogenase